MSQIDKFTAYDATTETRGLLMGNSPSTRSSSSLRMMTSSVAGADPNYTRISSIGITVGNGAKLQFDEKKFRAAYTANPAAVERLFTLTVQQKNTAGETVTKQVGLCYRINKVITDITTSSTGSIARETDKMTSRQDLFQRQIDSLQAMIDRKQTSLETQFQAMETALSSMQTQQSAIASLASLASA